MDEEVLTGWSESLLVQPKEAIESLKDADAICVPVRADADELCVRSDQAGTSGNEGRPSTKA